jgi:hypothetical protein
MLTKTSSGVLGFLLTQYATENMLLRDQTRMWWQVTFGFAAIMDSGSITCRDWRVKCAPQMCRTDATSETGSTFG